MGVTAGRACPPGSAAVNVSSGGLMAAGDRYEVRECDEA